MNMLGEQKILSLLHKTSPLTIEELASSLDVSEPTIRRDLTLMEEKGLILKQR